MMSGYGGWPRVGNAVPAGRLLALDGGPFIYGYGRMAYRAGAALMDMEMVKFHPTGLLVGDMMISGTVLEEGLRGSGAYLKNSLGERYMHRYDSRDERATA